MLQGGGFGPGPEICCLEVFTATKVESRRVFFAGYQVDPGNKSILKVVTKAQHVNPHAVNFRKWTTPITGFNAIIENPVPVKNKALQVIYLLLEGGSGSQKLTTKLGKFRSEGGRQNWYLG